MNIPAELTGPWIDEMQRELGVQQSNLMLRDLYIKALEKQLADLRAHDEALQDRVRKDAETIAELRKVAKGKNHAGNSPQ